MVDWVSKVAKSPIHSIPLGVQCTCQAGGLHTYSTPPIPIPQWLRTLTPTDFQGRRCLYGRLLQ